MIDLVPREKLLALTAELNAIVPFERTFMVSALKADGIGDLLAAFAQAVPPGAVPLSRGPGGRPAAAPPRLRR